MYREASKHSILSQFYCHFAMRAEVVEYCSKSSFGVVRHSQVNLGVDLLSLVTV